MIVWKAAQGFDASFTVTIRDSDGNPLTIYDGSEPLEGLVWPGQDLASTFTLAPAWVDPSQGLVAVTVSAADTASLGIGSYRVQLWLTDSGAERRDFFEGVLAVESSPGTALTLPVYCTYQDMLDLALWTSSATRRGSHGNAPRHGPASTASSSAPTAGTPSGSSGRRAMPRSRGPTAPASEDPSSPRPRETNHAHGVSWRAAAWSGYAAHCSGNVRRAVRQCSGDHLENGLF